MTAVITGSSSGIGLATANELKKNGYEVIAFQSRLENLDEVEKECKEISLKHNINVLLHCAGFGIFEPIECTSSEQIKKLIDVNLTAPIIITSNLLRNLRQNKAHIISISSIEALRHSKFSTVYTASKTALRAFSLSLFEEVRKSGIKVTNINPDITKTNFFSSLHFEPSDKEDTFLNPEDIAKSIIDVLNFKGVITELTLRPQKFEIKKKN